MTSKRPKKGGIKPTDDGDDVPEEPKAGKVGRAPERKPIHRVLHGAASARARRGQRRPKTGDDEQKKGRGPAPEVNCNPPAEHPRPPFAFQRETYHLELRGSCGRVQAPSLYLDRTQRCTSIQGHTADLSHHTEVTLQVVPRLNYSLRLLVDNEERELQRINNRTWEPAKPLYAPCFLDTCTY